MTAYFNKPDHLESMYYHSFLILSSYLRSLFGSSDQLYDVFITIVLVTRLNSRAEQFILPPHLSASIALLPSYTPSRIIAKLGLNSLEYKG